MGYPRYDFVADMEAGKARVLARQNRGLGGGKAAKGWIRGSRRPDEGGPTGEELASAYGLLAVALAIEDHMRALYPARYDWPAE
jgi:hypothetical protein